MLFAGKMQHSVWVVDVISSNLEVENANILDLIPSGVVPKQFSFRRIWQGKGVQTAACKVLVYLLDFVFTWISVLVYCFSAWYYIDIHLVL